MSGGYVPPGWRIKGSSRPDELHRADTSYSDSRDPIPSSSRGRGRDRPGPSGSSGSSRWRTAQGHPPASSGGDIWSSMPGGVPGGNVASTTTDIWSSIPSTSSSRAPPSQSTPRPSRNDHQNVRAPGRFLPGVQRPTSGPTPHRYDSPSTPARAQTRNQPTSLGSPSADLTPISSTHRAFKKLDEMEMLGTLSRSGGSEDGVGDGLLDPDTQEKFFGWIEKKLETFYTSYPTFRDSDLTSDILFPRTSEEDQRERAGKESLDVILLHFRKLREGILASRRTDAFSVKVYELSTLLSIRSRNHPQLISSLSILVPSIYEKYDQTRQTLEAQVQDLSIDSTSTPDRRAFFTSLLLIYHIAQRDSTVDFWTDYFKLTRGPSRGRRRGHNQTQNPVPPTNAGRRFIDPNHASILLAVEAYRSITQPSPLAYYRLLHDLQLKMEQKIVLGFALDRMRTRTWEIMRTAWSQGVGVGFASALLGYPEGTVHPISSPRGEDEWEEHFSNKKDVGGQEKRVPPSPVGLVDSLGGRIDGVKVVFK